jgi:hypothetical protein
MTPGGGTNIDPRALICTILLDVHYTMFHANYLYFSLFKFKEGDFNYKHIRKTYGPRGRANYDTRGKIWTIFGRVPIDDII